MYNENMKSQSKSRHLRDFARKISAETLPMRRLRVFDFDDTLVKTDAVIHVTRPDGTKITMSPGEFVVYDKNPGDTFDYDEFKKLVNAREIEWVGKLLRMVYERHGTCAAVILSARSTDAPIKQFLELHGHPEIEVVALDTADPSAKSDWIDKRITRDRLEMIEFFDDSHVNVAAIKRLRTAHPTVKIVAHHVVHHEPLRRPKKS